MMPKKKGENKDKERSRGFDQVTLWLANHMLSKDGNEIVL